MSMFNTPRLADPLERVARLLAAGDLRIEVDRTYDLEGVAEAHRDVMADSVFGKLVVVP
jgi:NADPH:quinone reductase-like Zn-dependent oxidoreductase